MQGIEGDIRKHRHPRHEVKAARDRLSADEPLAGDERGMAPARCLWIASGGLR